MLRLDVYLIQAFEVVWIPNFENDHQTCRLGRFKTQEEWGAKLSKIEVRESSNVSIERSFVGSAPSYLVPIEVVPNEQANAKKTLVNHRAQLPEPCT